MGRPFQKLQRFFRELKRRNVYKVAVAYVAVAFVAIQAADLLVPQTTLPGYADKLLIYLAVFGFPVTLFVAWAFEMTPEGVRRKWTGVRIPALETLMSECRAPLLYSEKCRWLDGSGRYAFGAGAAAMVGVLLAGSLFAACERSDPPQLSPERKAAVKDTIRSLITVGPFPDPQPYLELYGHDAPFYTEGTRLARNQHERSVRDGYPMLASIEVKPSDPEVDVLGPRAAVASILLRGHVTDTASERRKLTGAITQVYQLRDGEWKVVQAHESFAPGESF